ncbi:hypothetical protein ACN47E_002829 [Coniothyrium glycines]
MSNTTFLEQDIVLGAHRYISSATLDLAKILNGYNAQSPISYIHIFCDVLTCGTGQDVWKFNFNDTKLSYIHVFARILSSDKTNDNHPHIVLDGMRASGGGEVRRSIAFFYEEAKNFNFSIDGTTFSCAERAEYGYAGVVFPHKDSEQKLVTSVPPSLLKSRFAAAKKTIPPSLESFRPTQLSTLLNALFFQAYQQLFKGSGEESIAISRLRFVVRIARNAPELIDLCVNAHSLLKALELPNLDPFSKTSEGVAARFHVPRMSWQVNEKRLEDAYQWVKECEATENSVVQTGLQLSHITNGFGLNLALKELGAPHDIDVILKERKAQLLKAIDEAQATRTKLETENDAKTMEAAGLELKNALNDYTQHRKEKAQFDMCISVATLGATVGVAIYTGSAAGLATKTDLISKVGHQLLAETKTAITLVPQSTIWDETKREIIEFSDLIPSLSSGLKGSFNDMKRTEDKQLPPLTDMLKTADLLGPVEYIALMAEWRRFGLSSSTIFEKMGKAWEQDQQNATSTDQARVTNAIRSLKTQTDLVAIRAETLLSQQLAVSQVRQEYYLNLAIKEGREQDQKKIDQLGKDFQQNSRIIAVENARALETAQAGKQRAQMHFLVVYHQALSDCVFDTGRGEFPPELVLNQLLDAESLRKARDRLVEIHRAIDEKGPPQTFPAYTVSTEQEGVFDRYWRDSLVKAGRIDFAIPMEGHYAKDHGYLRVQDIRTTFYIETNNTLVKLPNVMCVIHLGPNFRDRNKDTSKIIQYWTTPYELEVHDEDGKWSEQDLKPYNMPTPFCDGKLTFDADAWHKYPGPQLGDVKKVELKLVFKGKRSGANGVGRDEAGRGGAGQPGT